MAKRSTRAGLSALLFAALLCAPAREGARAQFTFPYDPDFPTEPKKKTEEPAKTDLPVKPLEPGATTGEPKPLPEGQQPVILLPPSAGRFQLQDRVEADRFLYRPPEKPSTDLHEFLKDFRPFTLNNSRWNKMRSDLERGVLPTEEILTPIEPIPVEELIASTETPKPAPPEVELPGYGTSLSVTGRKVIGFNYSQKSFFRDQKTTGRPKSTNLIDISQQLQLRMQGKVGPKITVNVDYDDTKTNKQDISVVYTGDPNEVVQNASFGDIDLSLPSTEFVSYNKQLFGIRADIKYKGFNASFIGSRTKGTTKAKQFIGNTQFASADIPDVAYVRRQYYDLSFGNAARLPIKPGSERLFLAQQNPQAVNANSFTTTADDLAVQTSSFTGIFNQLLAGQDYTVDYVKGIVTFRTPLQPQFVVAVDYIDATNSHIVNQTTSSFTGGTGNFKLIKTSADLAISQSTTTAATEVGFNRELKTVYNVGATQIVRDDGRGNFILRIIDPQTRAEVGNTLNPVQRYPDTINVDFENGLFRLLQPFGTSVSSSTPDPDIYAPTPISRRLLHVEYKFRLKTFFLEPNLVLQSETVLVDGIKLVRNVDYFIDYDSGFITFFNPDRIGTHSEVNMIYEVAPFAGVTSESILGTRVSHSWKKFSIGSTLLYEAGTKSPTTPTVDQLAKSLLVYDFDSQLRDISIGKSFKIKLLGGEFAQSHQDPNLNGRALIDNMEGIKQEVQAGLLASQWQIAANPQSTSPDPQSLSIGNADIPTLAINPHAQARANDTQKVLTMTYNFGVNGTTETSMAYTFSPTGFDFSQKSILEVTMFGDGSGNQINFTLGQLNEDVDGNGGMTLNCADGRTLFNAPKTEDLNCDGILQPSEDVGWLYSPAGKNFARIGAGNGRLDNIDYNQNNRLDPANLNAGDNFGYNFSTGTANNQLFDASTGSTFTAVNFAGWHEFQIPLNISTATASRWTNIVSVRVSVRQTVGPASGTLMFAKIAAAGNSWLAGQSGDPKDGSGPKAFEKVTVNAVNNVDNPTYIPIFNAAGEAQTVYNDLYGSVGQQQQQSNSKNLSEQALQINWEGLTAGTTIYTKRQFLKPLDISQHKRFNFLVYGNADANHVSNSTDTVFFLRAGSDQSYFEMDIPLNFTGWRLFIAEQFDPGGGQIPNSWKLVQGVPGTVVFSTGSPTLQQIPQLVAGVYAKGGTVAPQEAVWLNEIYLSDPLTRSGFAEKIQADFEVLRWATFGMKFRFVDRNYQTPTTTVSNQDNRQDTAYLNLTRLQFFPMAFNISRIITDTPNTNAVGNNANVVNLLQTGKVTNWNGSASGNFAYGAYPRVQLGYVRARTEYQLLTRLDDRNTYNTAMTYAIPLNYRMVPKTVDISGSYSKYSVSFESLASRQTPGNFNTDELTKTVSLRTTFVPWTGSSFNPNYSLSTVDEKRSDFTSGAEINSRYPKSQNQTIGFSSNFRLRSWLNPAVSYTDTNIENNILNVSTFVVRGSTYVFNVGDIKTVNRSANGSITLPISIADIVKGTKLFRSFSLANSYQLQDGDTWNNVEKELGTKMALWLRTPLRTSGPAAQLVNQTLRDTYSSTQRWSPIEAYALTGRKSAFKTLSLSNNYVQSIQRTNTTGTLSKTISTTLPDLVASLGQVEKLVWADRWMSNGQVNLKYAAHQTKTVGVSLNTDDAIGTDIRAMIKKKFDTAISYNVRNSAQRDLNLDVLVQTSNHQDATVQTTFDIRKFRFTPKVDYANDLAKQGTGVVTQNLTVVTPSLLARADLALPRGLLLPFSKTPILFSNRIIWTNTVSMAFRSSPVTVADNSKLLSFNTSGDYELAKNLRMTLNGAFSRMWHNFLKEEEFMSYQFGTTLTFQF